MCSACMQRMSTVRVCSALVHFVSEVLVRIAWVQYVFMDAVHVRSADPQSAVYVECCACCGVLCMRRMCMLMLCMQSAVCVQCAKEGAAAMAARTRAHLHQPLLLAANAA